MRYFIKLSYDGAPFNGWQFQPNAPTVQECLENSLSTLLKSRVSVVGAGRTDSQVNAVGYIAHFDFDGPVPAVLSDAGGELDTVKVGYKLNAILPRGIVVHEVHGIQGDLHARFSASRREYTYFIHRTKDPFIENHSYFCPWDLDVDAMNEAARYLLGAHDFRCFEKIGSDNKTSDCVVFEARWLFYEPSHVTLLGYSATPGSPADSGRYLYFRIAADRFLRNMVRAVVGSLLEVGRGRRSVEDFASLVLPCTGPASGASDIPGGSVGSSAVPAGSASDLSAACGSSAGPAGSASDGACVSSARHRVRTASDGTPFRSLAGESVPGHALFLSKVEY